jgi:uncharacterized protein YndB with AHSA1/START domain
MLDPGVRFGFICNFKVAFHRKMPHTELSNQSVAQTNAISQLEKAMNNFEQQVSIAAHPSTVFAALTTIEGVRGWWTEDSDMEGEMVRVRFGATHKAFSVHVPAAGNEVRWHCLAAHIAHGEMSKRDEWIGTTLVFRLVPEGEGTRLEFEHVGLLPELQCFEMCNKGWRHFLESLRQYAQDGGGTPYRLPVAEEA